LGEFSPFGWLFTSVSSSWKLHTEVAKTIPTTFFRGNSYELFFTKNGLGYILGDFFTNASGHPGLYICTFWQIGKGRFHSVEILRTRNGKKWYSGNRLISHPQFFPFFLGPPTEQGDQMSWWKKSPKIQPKPLFIKINTHLFLRKKVAEKFSPLL
jgi:hypothetical protein